MKRRGFLWGMTFREFCKAMGDAVVELFNKLLTVEPPVEKTCENCALFRNNKCQMTALDPDECIENDHFVWTPREGK